MERKKMILIEFNELCPDLLNGWMAAGQLPNFKLFYENSQVFITEPDETLPPYLEPWIQWYSTHTGLSYRQHGVFHLTDGPKAGHRDIWQILMLNGKTVGNCSSMNARSFDREGSFFLPDPWSTTEQAFPPELNSFYRVVANRVQEYTNRDKRLKSRDLISFVKFLLLHGQRTKTIYEIAKQFFLDTVRNDGTTWKRVALLDKLQFDVFRYYHRSLKPDFSTFFVNSTAHYQHMYWRHMSPELFVNRPSAAERAKYANAILFGYQEMDKLLGDFFEFENSGAFLILATALSQQPYLKREAQGGQHFYRARDIEALLGSLHIRYDYVFPVMAHQYMIRFQDSESTEIALRALKSVRYGGKEVFGFSESEPKSIYFGNQIYCIVPEGARIEIGVEVATTLPYYQWFYKIEDTKSGCHHPDGVLWFKTGDHKIHDEKASILDIFPTVLSYFDINIPRDIAPSLKGKDLLPSLN